MLKLINDDIPLGDIDTQLITDMSSLFYKSQRSNYDGIENWDVSNVKDMSHMFDGASSFNQDISNWNVSNVKDMSHMFSRASNFNQDISNWNVFNVKDMSGMFESAINFKQNLSSWYVPKDTDLSGMFYYSDMDSETSYWPNYNN